MAPQVPLLGVNASSHETELSSAQEASLAEPLGDDPIRMEASTCNARA